MKVFKYIIGIIFCGLLLSACQGFVTPNKDNTLNLKQVKKNADFSEGILLRAYQHLGGIYSDTQNEAVATNDAVSNVEGNSLRRMATGEWSARYDPVSEWNSSYEAIYQLNKFINDIVDDVDWASRSVYEQREFTKRLKGEAYGLRAYFEFQLLQSHSGKVNGNLLGYPIITKALKNDDNYRIPRNTFKESLNQIMADADSAIKYLPKRYDKGGEISLVYGDRFRGRINSRVAQGIKSKATLLAASPAYDVIKWNRAAKEAAKLVKGLGGASALPTDGDKFWLHRGSKEIIWRRDYKKINYREADNFPPSLYGEGAVNPSNNLVKSFPMANGYPISNSSSGYDSQQPYKNRDPRLRKYIIFNGAKLKGENINTINGETDGLNQQDNSTRTGYYLKKLLDPDVSLNPSGGVSTRHFKTFMRYTEFYLNYAEAANESWGPDGDPEGYGFTAREIIQAIRKRAGISQPDQYLASRSGKKEMRNLIRNERRLELCFEGFRFWDVRRWDAKINKPVYGVSSTNNGIKEFTVEQRRYKPYMIYGPIPYNEVLKYDGLKQNDGW